ncbi:hypothetical protein BY458DRAFT_507348 [Sporodiniella umbellata]|nr:hypothetical protein BY458DRAFT_507348 [Sporodiniella umbellata]
MIPFVFCPATCELCGNWIPNHEPACPRNGVHPSQWTTCLMTEDDTEQEEEQEHHLPLTFSTYRSAL